MGGRWRQWRQVSTSALFTAAVHGLLFIFLTIGFSWVQTIEPGGAAPIEARAVSDKEVRAARQQRIERAERARQAQAARERKLAEQRAEKKRKAEQKRKAEAAAKAKAEAEQKAKAEAARQLREDEQRRKDELRRQIEAEQRAQTQREAADALSALVDRIRFAVRKNWRKPQTSQAGLSVTIRVKVAQSGRVLSAVVAHSSGDSLFDRSAEIAVHKSSPLPFPPNPEYYEYINEFDFKFSPDALR